MSAEGDRALQILVDAIVDIGPPAGTDVRDLAIGLWSLAHGVSMLEIDRRIAGKTMKSAEDVISLMNTLILRALH
jgi:hypothetical protein